LIDAPEMNYLSTDVDTNGIATPRGEICIKGNGNFLCYYKNEKATQEIFTNDGFVLTGDIGII
jgi:long-chain acyl-CoA synthetase